MATASALPATADVARHDALSFSTTCLSTSFKLSLTPLKVGTLTISNCYYFLLTQQSVPSLARNSQLRLYEKPPIIQFLTLTLYMFKGQYLYQ